MRYSFRVLVKDRINTIVIILSLAAGIACTNLVTLFIVREMSTDSFQRNHERIYLLKCDDPFIKGEKMFVCMNGAAEYMKNNFSQVEDFCRINKVTTNGVEVNNTFYFDHIVNYKVSSNFLRFFTYELSYSNSRLETASDIIISAQLAEKYFGSESPVGKHITLRVGETRTDYFVTGVFRKSNTNSQFSFDVVTLGDESDSYAYLLLRDKTDPEELERLFSLNKEQIPNINNGEPGQYYLENIKQSYFDTTQSSPLGRVREKSDMYIATLIGLMIFIVALFNYIGLISNRINNAQHELYIRRINGCSRWGLLKNMTKESLIIITLSIITGMMFIITLLPFFNSLTNSEISHKIMLKRDEVLFIIAIIILLVFFALTSGFINITRLPLLSDRHKVNNKRRGRHIKPALITGQLFVSMILLVCSVVITKQTHYIENKDIGFDKNIYEIKLPEQYAAKAGLLKDEIMKNPAVRMASVAVASPLQEYWMTSLSYNRDGQEAETRISIFKGDDRYLETLGIQLLYGTGFNGDATGNKNRCIINETLAEMLGGETIIGNSLPGFKNLTVTGIVKDFNYNSLRKKVEPTVITYSASGCNILVRSSSATKDLLKLVKEEWKRIIPDYPPDIDLLSDRFMFMHKEEMNLSKLLMACCVISFILSIAGLFRLAYSTSRNRTSEIGIRKINGATTTEILLLLNRSFIVLTLAAFVLSLPFAAYLSGKWLEFYAYKITLTAWPFISGGFITLAIVVITVSWQSWSAATSNPVETLRHD